MKISIEYCNVWNYLPKASSLEEYLTGKYDAKIKLVSSGGGVFEVCLEDKLIFSKKSLGRFPEHSEIDDLINQNLN